MSRIALVTPADTTGERQQLLAQIQGALGGGVIDAKLGAQIGDEDVASLRDSGFSDEAIVEILAHVALNLFTNYVNVAFKVPVDFPSVKLRAK